MNGIGRERGGYGFEMLTLPIHAHCVFVFPEARRVGCPGSSAQAHSIWSQNRG